MLVRPTIPAPAARSRATAGASAFAGGAPARIFERARVTSPARSKRSFTDTGRPSTGERTAPEILCEECDAALPRLGSQLCPRCALAAPGGSLCGRCLAHSPHYDATV